MNAPKARVIAHEVRIDETRVAVRIRYRCPFCGSAHGAMWHSPTSEGGDRPAPCTINPATGLGAYVALHWPGIPGAVSAALLEFRPGILSRADLSDPRTEIEGGQ